MYTIKHAAQLVGIAPPTLRAWERRYGVVTPQRTEGGYRVYDERDVEVLRSMKELMDQGWQPALAAREASRRDRPVMTLLPPGPDSPSLGAELVDAAAALDAGRLTAVLDRLFALDDFAVVMTRHVFPALEDLGTAWSAGWLSVAGEHLASHAVMRRLAVAYEAAERPQDGPLVVLGMAPGVRHELGLLTFAVVARRRGLSTTYLGADLPLEDWLGFVDDRRPAAVVLAVPTVDDIDATHAVISALRERNPELVIAVGGAEQAHSPDGALRLGHDLVAGARTLRAALAH